jgi:hypothetical protein
LKDPERLGLDYDATPSFDEVLAVRRERMDAVKATIDHVTAEELAPICVPEGPGHPARARCWSACTSFSTRSGSTARTRIATSPFSSLG